MFSVEMWDEWARSIYIIIAGIVIQQLLSRLIFPWIKNRVQNRLSKTFQDILVNSIARPIDFLIIMTALYLGLNSSPLHLFSKELFLHIYKSVIIVAFYGIFYNLSDNSNGNLTGVVERFNMKLDPLLINLGSSVLRMLIVVLAFLTLAREWNYDVSPLIAGLGLGGLALAMAAKDSLSNIFGGFVILTDKPFTIGDWINAAGFEGTVEDVTFRSTRIRTIDQGIAYVPNANLSSVPITNFSRRARRRANFTIGLTYFATKEQLEQCVAKIKQMLDADDRLTKAPGDTLVVFSGYGESSLDIYIIYYVATSRYADYMQVNNDIYFKIMDIVQETKAGFAFPSRSLYIQEPIVIQRASEKSNTDVKAEVTAAQIDEEKNAKKKPV